MDQIQAPRSLLHLSTQKSCQLTGKNSKKQGVDQFNPHLNRTINTGAGDTTSRTMPVQLATSVENILSTKSHLVAP